METLQSVRRVDFSLIGAFADMVSSSVLETEMKSSFDGLFVLTRPGKLHFYCTESLSALLSQTERKSPVSGTESPVVIPISDPQMTAAKLSLQPSDGNLAMWLSEVLYSVKMVNRGVSQILYSSIYFFAINCRWLQIV